MGAARTGAVMAGTIHQPMANSCTFYIATKTSTKASRSSAKKTGRSSDTETKDLGSTMARISFATTARGNFRFG